MNKKLLIIASNSREFYTTKRLLEEGEKKGFSTRWIHPYEQTVPLSYTEKNGIYFHRSTGTNYDDFDLIVSEAHELSGLKIINPLSAIRALRTKDQQWCFFERHRLPHIDSLMIRGKVSPEMLTTIESWSKIDERFVLKMSRGNQGIGVNLVRGVDSLLSLLETFHAMKDQRFLLQTFVSHLREWRLFVHRGKILACLEKHIEEKDFRGNAKRSQSKNVDVKNISKELSELTLKSFTLSQLDHAGIDILEDKKGNLKILEINAIPGFEQAEKLSGCNIARELLGE